MNLSFMYEQARAPITSTGLQDGFGLSTNIMFPSLIPQTEMALFSIQPGASFDVLGHGKSNQKFDLLDPWGVDRSIFIRSGSMTGAATIRFAMAERFALRPYVTADLGLRHQYTYEDWSTASDCDDEIENVNLERSFAPSMGMGAGFLVKLGQTASLDLGVSWRQTGAVEVVDLESLQVAERNSYTYQASRSAGQFVTFRLGVNFLLDDCGPTCDHTRCCSPSRHSLQPVMPTAVW
ncbi:MAG: hypothetical protein NWR72_20155 [Bacteroidia bacterium]|nr:hypothetical protein [Bacteroidia bacterium]